jgi:hypothetical protein
MEKLVKCFIWSTELYGGETRALRKVDQKYLRNFELWCWRRIEKITGTERVRSGEVLHRAKEERNILHTVIRRKSYWIGHVWRSKCSIRRIIEEKI